MWKMETRSGHREYVDFDLENSLEENESNFRALPSTQINTGNVTLKEHF